MPSLSTARKVGYGIGDTVVGIRETAIQFYLLPLYTDVVVIAPWLAGLGKMVGFVWDGLNDPVTGYLSDRTRTRVGRRRPFLLGAALPLGLAFGFLWSPPAGLGSLSGFLYMVFGFLLFDTCFTLYSTPYLALGAELSRDYHERTQLSAWRSLFRVIGHFIGGVVPGAVLAARPDAPAAAFAAMGFGLGAFMTAVALLTGTITREAPPSSAPTQAPPSWRSFVAGVRTTLENRPFRVMLVAFGVVLLAGGIHQSVVPYAFRYWIGRPDLVNQVIGFYLLAAVVSLPIWTRVARRFGKDRALRACMLWSVTSLTVLPIALSPDMGTLRLTVLVILAGLGSGGWNVLPVAIAADIVDHDELATDTRREGAFFGLWTLVMKLSTGLASGIVGFGLQIAGYVPNQVQSPEAILGIRLLYGPIPAAVMLVAWLVFRRFPLTRARHQEVQLALAQRGRP